LAFNFQTGLINAPVGAGNQSINVGTGFAPKAVMLWSTGQTAVGANASADAKMFGRGFGTYRSSTAEQRWTCVASENNDQTAAHYATGGGDASILQLIASNLDAAPPTNSYLDVQLVSMDDDEIVLNFSTTTSGVDIFYAAFGGSDITDARVGTVTTTNPGPDDVTVATGFGRPRWILFDMAWYSGDGFTNNDMMCALGWAARDASDVITQGMTAFQADDGAGTMAVSAKQVTNRVSLSSSSPGVIAWEGSVDTTLSNWPTDGFQMNSNTAQAGNEIYYLALQGDFTVAMGQASSLTSTGDQDNACGFAPKGALVATANIASTTSFVTSATGLGGQGIGAYDGTSESFANITETDNNGNSRTRNTSSTTKALICTSLPTTTAAATQIVAADGAFSGNNFRLTYTTVDATARAYLWVAFGDAPSSGTTYTKSGFGRESA
jgi:hypothetical protein